MTTYLDWLVWGLGLIAMLGCCVGACVWEKSPDNPHRRKP